MEEVKQKGEPDVKMVSLNLLGIHGSSPQVEEEKEERHVDIEYERLDTVSEAEAEDLIKNQAFPTDKPEQPVPTDEATATGEVNPPT